jgi:hypothetical protein
MVQSPEVDFLGNVEVAASYADSPCKSTEGPNADSLTAFGMTSKEEDPVMIIFKMKFPLDLFQAAVYVS